MPVKNDIPKLKKLESSNPKPFCLDPCLIMRHRNAGSASIYKFHGSCIFTGICFLIFSDKLPVCFFRKVQEIDWTPMTKSRKFLIGILLPYLAISGAFLQHTAGSDDRKLRPEMYR